MAYGAGLRVSEVIALKVADIDSARMVIRIEAGKGRKDRLAKLSSLLLEGLRGWWMNSRLTDRLYELMTQKRLCRWWL